MNGGESQPVHRIEREAIDVEHDRTASGVGHGQVEERRAGLLGVDADRCLSGAQTVCIGRRRQDEELVRCHHQIVDRIVGHVG